jgi:MFS family permease
MTNASWRWCFAINLPVATAGLLVAFFILRKELLGPQPIPEVDGTIEPGRRMVFVARLKTIDFGGQILFLFGFGLIVLALTWGGATYPWSSAAVLTPLIIGCILVVCFIIWQRLMSPGRALSAKMPWAKAMIPWSILTHKDIGLVWWTECMSGVALYAVSYCSVLCFKP